MFINYIAILIIIVIIIIIIIIIIFKSLFYRIVTLIMFWCRKAKEKIQLRRIPKLHLYCAGINRHNLFTLPPSITRIFFPTTATPAMYVSNGSTGDKPLKDFQKYVINVASHFFLNYFV
jgi:hypothetical protein